MAAHFPNWQKQERVLARRAGVVLGIALSMFFDGIVLHQLLQWHHTISNWSGTPQAELNTFWDGVFHAAAYVVLLVGLLLLWHLVTNIEPAKVRRPLLGYVLIGFGAFNIVESIVSHWILQLHHVRDGVERWWIYDGVFFLVAGVLVAVAGWTVLRRERPLMPREKLQ